MRAAGSLEQVECRPLLFEGKKLATDAHGQDTDMKSGYTAEELDQARKETEEAAYLRRNVPDRGDKITLVRQIHKKAFFNAIIGNGGVQPDGTNIWHDKEFVSDMERRHPEIKVGKRSCRPMVGARGDNQGCFRCRLGVASFHKSYGTGVYRITGREKR